jgi:hypothetical protein
MVAPAYLEHDVIGQRLARFVDLALTGEHQAGHDQRLGARPAFGKAAIDEHLVCAKLCHALPYQSRVATAKPRHHVAERTTNGGRTATEQAGFSSRRNGPSVGRRPIAH